MNPQFYTYLHCRPDGEPFYVGKGFGRRASNLSRRNDHHKNIVSKYGKENIRVFIFNCESEYQALSDEVSQIAQLRLAGYVLANKTDGGEGVSNPTADVRAKIALGQKGKVRSPEHCAKLSAARNGQTFHAGYSETLSSAMKKRYENQDAREKTSAAMILALSSDVAKARKSAASKRMWLDDNYRNKKTQSLIAMNPKGERCKWSKLTTENVIDIRARREAGASLAILAAEFGMSLSSISEIANRKSWKSVN